VESVPSTEICPRNFLVTWLTSGMMFWCSLTFIKTQMALQFSVRLPVSNFVKICPSVFRVKTCGRSGRHDLSLRSVFTIFAETDKSQRTVMLRKSCLEYLTYILKYVKILCSLWINKVLEGGKAPRIRVGRVSLKILRHFLLTKTKQLLSKNLH